ncbi:transcriptional regulator, Spx/MgsR family protein [Acidovorax sp. RAC01]|nr:transcriptional regulator, Spx/MgsR family protein [Acidovorax sp. RAC01]
MMEAMTSTQITLYGISNCDTVKKARAWFTAQALSHDFHDFKKQGVPTDALDRWTAAVSWQKLVNRSGTTWRKLDAPTQSAVVDALTASALMTAQPSVIKRPVVELRRGSDHLITVGYVPEQWEAWTQHHITP